MAGSSGGSTYGRRSSAKPVTAKDKAMTKRHLRESIAFNEKHAAEHKKAASEDRKLLRKRGGK